jgi:hypothetical protein
MLHTDEHMEGCMGIATLLKPDTEIPLYQKQLQVPH